MISIEFSKKDMPQLVLTYFKANTIEEPENFGPAFSS